MSQEELPTNTTRDTRLRCGSRHLMREVDVITPSASSLGDLKARIYRVQLKRLSMTVAGNIKANICADCGHTELVTDNLV